jgi:hypothetical protein
MNNPPAQISFRNLLRFAISADRAHGLHPLQELQELLDNKFLNRPSSLPCSESPFAQGNLEINKLKSETEQGILKRSFCLLSSGVILRNVDTATCS